MQIVGRGRYARDTYPTSRLGAVSPISLYDNALYPQAYGARTDVDPDDAAAVTANTAALQAWLDACETLGRAGRMPSGTYWTNNSLYARGVGGGIVGDGRYITRLSAAPSFAADKAMLVWSKPWALLQGLSLWSDYEADYGFVLQRGARADLSFDVQACRKHGVVISGVWEGLADQGNWNATFHGVRSDFNGRTDIQTVVLTGTGLGGTFTLTLGANTTAPIAWNANAATVAAALKAANTGLSNANGVNSFITANTLSGGMTVEFWGAAAGPQPLMTMDTTNITGTITSAGVVHSRVGTLGHGFAFLETVDGGNNNSPMTFNECDANQNAGNGLTLIGTAITVRGGHYEGNVNTGCRLLRPAALGFTTDCFIDWAYFEANWGGAVVSGQTVGEGATRNLSLLGSGVGLGDSYDRSGSSNALLSAGAGGLVRAENNEVFGSFRTHFGTTADSRILAATPAGSVVPLNVDAAFEEYKSQLSPGTGNLNLDPLPQRNFYVSMTGTVPNLIFTNAPRWGYEVSIFFLTPGTAFQVTNWPAGTRFAGGTPPVLGSGGPGSSDAITFRYFDNIWQEVSRSLGNAP